jgi:hypothetical protein
MLEGVDQIARAQSARMSLELVCLRIADRPSFESLTAIAQNISRLEGLSQKHLKREPVREVVREAVREPVREVVTVKESAKVEAVAPPEEAKVQISGFDEKWIDFVKAITRVNQSIGVYLEHGRPEKNAVVSFEHRFYRDRIVEVIKEAWFLEVLSRIYGPGTIINWTFQEQAAPNTISIREAREIEQKNAQAQIEQSARNHPVVKKALALFGGEIKAVRSNAPKVPQGAAEESSAEGAAD